ncbi:MAG: thioredoxin fold domain-containing protein [Candidatus Gastranaerophilales bacterium]|nr:thioredoxin fold domain-containing protein [Candidatus Gastranaerophilales bacterium]
MSEEQKIENQPSEKCCSKKLSVLALIVSIVALGFSLCAYFGDKAPSQGGNKPVVISKQYDKGRSLEKAIKTEKPMIIFFYTDWCGFCQRFVPTFDKVSKDRKFKKDFAVAYVNCENQDNAKYAQEYGVDGYPTVYVVKGDKKVHLDNGMLFSPNAKDAIIEEAYKVIE